MPSCEKCWSEVSDAPLGDAGECYAEMIKTHNCTPEEQAGPDAANCPECGRRTAHQLCRVCMACGYDPKVNHA